MTRAAITTKNAEPRKLQLDKLESIFQGICRFCSQYSKAAKPMSPGDLPARIVINSLKGLATQVGAAVLGDARAEYEVTFSKGAGKFPRVPWVAIVPVGSSVAKAPSVAICFGRNGEGAVVGLMEPAIGERSGRTIARTKDGEIRVDVNGSGLTAQYNNKFINPQEFLTEKPQMKKLLSHLHESLVLLRQYQ